MKHIVLISTATSVAIMFIAGLAMATGQQGSQQARGVLIAQSDIVGTASGESRQVQQETQQATSRNLNRPQVREVQKLLNQKGYQAGPVDGIIGHRTRQALRQFQKSQGIATTGNPNEKTLRALAPSARQLEFFGLSPQFGGQGNQQQMKRIDQQKQMNQPQRGQGVGPASGDSQ